MARDFPCLYPYSRWEAIRLGETQRYDDSFHLNVSCARDIEQAIRDYSDDSGRELDAGCAEAVIEKYGFKRVNFVLANSVRETGCQYLLSEDVNEWGKRIFVPSNGRYNLYFAADTAAVLLESFIGQARQVYQALGLFGAEHCEADASKLDYKGRVLVISPATLRESCWSPRDQLWLAEGGFGCSPTSRGRAVYALCLGDGERCRWNREDFIGPIREELLPDWAREQLERFRAGQQAADAQNRSGPEMKL